MSDTKMVTLRMPVELLAEVDAEAEKLQRSRHWVLLWRLKNSRSLPPLYSVDMATGGVEKISEDGQNGMHGAKKETSGVRADEAGDSARRVESGNKGGNKVGSGDAVHSRRSLGGSGVESKIAVGRKNKAAARQSECVGEEVKPWFPTSICPHGYQNSFVCEKSGGECKR